ncbi:MAG: hypothetical protein ACKON8_01950, partial [Planctomycetota bacterium]
GSMVSLRLACAPAPVTSIAAQALQRQTAVSAPSIADAYLAAKQAPGASTSADMAKLGMDAPTPQKLSTAELHPVSLDTHLSEERPEG